MPKPETRSRRCIWTGLPLPANQPRIRVHPAFRRATRGWSPAQRRRYADLARQLGTLQHSKLQALAQRTWQELRDAEARRLDRLARSRLNQALARDNPRKRCRDG